MQKLGMSHQVVVHLQGCKRSGSSVMLERLNVVQNVQGCDIELRGKGRKTAGQFVICLLRYGYGRPGPQRLA